MPVLSSVHPEPVDKNGEIVRAGHVIKSSINRTIRKVVDIDEYSETVLLESDIGSYQMEWDRLVYWEIVGVI